jgi:hypothetical protein
MCRLNCIPNLNGVFSPNLGVSSHDTSASNNPYLKISQGMRNASSYPPFKRNLKCLINLRLEEDFNTRLSLMII